MATTAAPGLVRLAQLAALFAKRHGELEEFRTLLEPLRVGGLEPIEGELSLLTDLETKLHQATTLLDALTTDSDTLEQLDPLSALLEDVSWELIQDLREELAAKHTRQADLLRKVSLDLKDWENRLAEVAKVIDGARLEGAPFSELEADLRAARSAAARVRSALTDRLYGALGIQASAAENSIAALETKTSQQATQVSKVKRLVKQADLLIMQVAGKRGKYEYRVLLRSADRYQTRGINIIQDVRSLSRADRTWMAAQIKQLTTTVNQARRSAFPAPHSGTAAQAGAARPTSSQPATPTPPGPARTISPAQQSVPSSTDTNTLLARVGDFMFRMIIPDQIQAYVKKESWSFTITTNDLELPWELLAFESSDPALDGGIRHLCLERSVSRMPLGGVFPQALPSRGPVATNRRRRMLLLYSDPDGNLPAARNEVDLIENQLGGRLEVERVDPKDATNAHINDLLTGQSFDFIHYAGHAYFDRKNPRESGLKLKDDVLTADKIRMLSRGGSLVFLNACESGTVARESEPQQVSYLLSTPEPVVGLASAFVYSGALGCVGSFWPVYDKPASELAVHFYQYVLNGEPTGEALRQARADIRTAYPREITWAGYALYGDPTFRLTET